VTKEEESLITDEMRASIGQESAPVVNEIDRLGVHQFARAVGHTDLIYFDEEYARSKGHRSLVAPPGYLGAPPLRPGMPAGPATADAGSGRRWRVLNGGSEYEYTGVDICAGDTLTAVSKTVDIRQREGSLGPMLITRRESVYTNQDGEVVCRAYGTILQY
jgi:acyl dehydratase